MIKAPQFEKVEGFDTSRNSLFEISLHVTDLGLVFVNFDASIDGPAVRFQDWYTGRVKEDVETLGLAKNGEYTWSQSWVIEGSFNWKAVIRKWRVYFYLFLPRSTPLTLGIRRGEYFWVCTCFGPSVVGSLRETSNFFLLGGNNLSIPHQHRGLFFPAVSYVSHNTPLIPPFLLFFPLPGAHAPPLSKASVAQF